PPPSLAGLRTPPPVPPPAAGCASVLADRAGPDPAAPGAKAGFHTSCRFNRQAPACPLPASQTARPPVFFQRDRAALADVIEAFLDRRERLSAQLIGFAQLRQIVQHVVQTLLWQGVDDLVYILAHRHVHRPCFDHTSSSSVSASSAAISSAAAADFAGM